MALKFIPPISIDYEKLERISEISSQISDLRKKISKVEEIKDSLENYKEKINVTVQNPLGELINFCTKQRIFKTCFAILFR